MLHPQFQMSARSLAGLFEWQFIMAEFFGRHFDRGRFFGTAKWLFLVWKDAIQRG
jgi:hypothetical protein